MMSYFAYDHQIIMEGFYFFSVGENLSAWRKPSKAGMDQSKPKKINTSVPIGCTLTLSHKWVNKIIMDVYN